MKQKDIALIVVIGIISAVMSFVISGKVFVTPAKRQQKVDTVPKISATFATPDTQYFNTNSINPTQLVTIGNNNNQNPFSSTSQ